MYCIDMKEGKDNWKEGNVRAGETKLCQTRKMENHVLNKMKNLHHF